MNINWSESVRLEHKVAEIIAKQERHGVYFDMCSALSLLNKLTQEILDIDQKVDSLLFPFPKAKGVIVHKPFKKDGSPTKMVEDWYGEDAGLVANKFTRIEWVMPNLQSREQLMRVLRRYGWSPDEYTLKGNPKLTESSMKSVVGDAGVNIARRFILSSRRAQLLGLIRFVRRDGRIPSEAIPNATPTGRMRHRKIVNIPAGRALYGAEFRKLFCAPQGRSLVGCDAAGLELRCLAARMDDTTYIDQILTGDIHSYNQNLAGLPTRDQAKTFIYALIYGAGNEKLGKIVGKGGTAGANLRRKFLTGLPKLGKLIDRVKKSAKRGYLKGLDGRAIFVRSEHSALNSLIQADGAIIMKVALCYVSKWIEERKLDACVVITYHDEFQIESADKDAKEVAVLAERAIKKAGEYFRLPCPLEGEAKIGRNWNQTH